MTLAFLRSSFRASKIIIKTDIAISLPKPGVRNISTGGILKSYIVSPEELSEALSKNSPTKISTAPRIIPLCAAWFLPNDPEGRTGQKVFAAKRIPSARFFDIDAVKDPDSPYPHMLPTEEGFAQAMSNLGIKKDDQLVIYDTQELGIFSAPRAAWTLRVFGHSNVHILNNFRLWVEQGYPTESSDASSVKATRSDYPVPTINPDMVINFRGVKEIVKDYGKEGSEGVQILDARSLGRFAGTEPEPRPGLSSGHMPGSINVPLPEILDPKTKAILPREALKEVFERRGIDPTKPVVTTCGTGVMAAVLETALNEAGYGNKNGRRVYDGSWTEWAQRVTAIDGLIKKV